VDEIQGVQVKLWYPLTMCAIPERLRDASCGGAMQIDDVCNFMYEIKEVEIRTDPRYTAWLVNQHHKTASELELPALNGKIR